MRGREGGLLVRRLFVSNQPLEDGLVLDWRRRLLMFIHSLLSFNVFKDNLVSHTLTHSLTHGFRVLFALLDVDMICVL